MSDGACVHRPDGEAHLMNDGLGLCASGEPDGEVRLRSGEASFAAFVEIGVIAQPRSDGPCLCAFGEAFLMTSSEHGPVAFAEASQLRSGVPGIGATDGAYHWRNDVLYLGGVSLLTNDEVGVSCLDDFGKFLLHTDLAG